MPGKHILNTAQQFKEPVKSEPRLKRIAGSISKHSRRPDALIEILHLVQDLYGYVPYNLMAYVSRELRIPPSRIYSVVTFYHFFSTKPRGEHNCLVCTGTACYVKGAQDLLDEMEKEFSLKPGETTPDQKLGLQVARCLGSCGIAPAIVVDDEVMAKVSSDNIVELVNKKMSKV